MKLTPEVIIDNHPTPEIFEITELSHLRKYLFKLARFNDKIRKGNKDNDWPSIAARTSKEIHTEMANIAPKIQNHPHSSSVMLYLLCFGEYR